MNSDGSRQAAALEVMKTVRDAARGDATAWQGLVAAHQEVVFRLAYLMLGDADEAQDIAQETFVRAWCNLDHFDQTRALRPWLLRIARNLAHNHRRSSTRQSAALLRGFERDAAVSTPDEISRARSEANRLWRAVHQLPELDQQMIYLRYFLDLSIAETAETMKMPRGTVKSRCYRDLRQLRGILERSDAGEDSGIS